MGLDFRKGSDLFVSSERELAAALGVKPEEVRAFRADPRRVPREVLARLGRALVERGSGMQRVGEMILEETGD